MKKLYFLSFCIFLISCSDKILKEECPEIACTMDFRSVTLKFKDAGGNLVAVTDFTSIIRNTGDSISTGAQDNMYNKGVYAVATDLDRKALSEKGDTIDVSATHPQTNQKKTVQFVIAGGKCACHIEKISGPEEVVFDEPNVPACVSDLIKEIKSQEVRNPAGSVWQYQYQGKTVYFIPQYCCDLPSRLLDSNCNLICSPDGGFIGKGDGKCSDFFTERKEGKLLWQDDRQ